MFNRIPQLGICILILGCLFSCSHETSYEGPVPGSVDTTKSGNFTAVINNNAWAAVLNTEDASLYQKLFSTITGTSSANIQIRISLDGTTTGQYVLNQHSGSYISYIDGNSGNTTPYTTYDGPDTSFAGGVVYVTAIDTVQKTITGNFQCKVFRNMDSHQQIITQGIFRQIPYLSTLPLAALGDTFQVKVDGVEWIPPSIGTSASSGQLTVLASERDGSKGASISMPLTISAGNFKMDPVAAIVFGLYKSPVTALLTSDTSGTLTILQNDALSRRIRGNFQFKAIDLTGVTADSALLSEGYFSLSY